MQQEKAQLGRMLVDATLLTEEQLRMAVDFQKSVGGKLGAILVKLRFIEEQTLLKFIARQQGLPIVNLDELVLPENLVKRIPAKLMEKHCVVPIHFHDGVLAVAMADPFDYDALDEIQLAVDCRIEIRLASRTQILNATRGFAEKAEGEAAAKEKSKDQILKDLDAGGARATDKVFNARTAEALVLLLIQKGIVTEAELTRKTVELEGTRGR